MDKADAEPAAMPIHNVFLMTEPQHMLQKLSWEIVNLSRAQSVWHDDKGTPEVIFIAFNTAVTAWHITDWLWQSGPQIRTVLGTRFNFVFAETRNGLRVGLERFQDAVATDSQPLTICREIANGSKHMHTTKSSPNIKANSKWHAVIQAVGLVKPGDLVLQLTISDGTTERDAESWFIEAFGYWEKLFVDQKLSAGMALPNRIIKAAN